MRKTVSVEGVAQAKAMLRKLVQDEITEIEETYKSEVRRRTPIDTGRARRGWQSRNKEISNSVPYIRRLENGYSKQAPRGFVNQAVNATVNKRKRT